MKRDADTCQEYSVIPQAVDDALSVMPKDNVLGRLALMFQAVADVNRLKILLAVTDRELCVCELTEVLSMSAPAVSHHLRRLKDMGLVRTRREGKWVYYTLDDEHVKVLVLAAMTHLKHKLE
jgi:ArsR family transcriptional regulator, lead/cadmium/zinc/bismuth-responsive transcriptional repressor